MTTTTKRSTKRPSKESSTNAEKKPRKAIPLGLKVEFINTVRAEKALDLKASVSSICRRPKFDFMPDSGYRILEQTDEILSRATQVGPRNAMTITRVFLRKLEVIERELFVIFMKEIENSKFLS